MMSHRRSLFLLSFLVYECVVTSITLLGGRFQTTTDVQSLLNLALDAADMKESDDFGRKKTIYTKGVSRDNEETVDVSLAELSLRASGDMRGNPYFHMFRHAFLVLGNAEEGETDGKFDGSAIEQYADTLVNDLFELNVTGIETEAAIVLNVWMAVINELFKVKIQCKANNLNMGLAALDRAAAMWIGEGQDSGVNDSGHLLYSLTENAGERFDQDNGEAIVNTKIIDLFVELQKDLRAGKCGSLTGYLNIRGLIRRMVSLMTIPLVQNLIHYTMNVSIEHGADWVELYALATIPRIAVCNPEEYDQTLHLDVLREMTPEYANQALAALERCYSCFGITCADVGAYRGGERAQCEDATGVDIVGYTSSREDVREKSYLDRDIKQIDVLMKFKAYDLARDWYEYGWNSVYNLQGLAKNEVIPRSNLPSKSTFDQFSDFYGGPNFADSYILELIEQQVLNAQATNEQRRWLLTDYLVNVVMYFSAVSAFEYAFGQCGTDKEVASDYWDTGAMFYIGSMEGELPKGNSVGGLLLFSTAKNFCEEFGTCADDSEVGGSDIPEALSNRLFVASLNQGLQQISDGCKNLDDTLFKDMLGVMPIPIIQGTVKYASLISSLPAGSDDASLAVADAFAKGVLPFVNEADIPSAKKIESAMFFQRETIHKPGDYLVVVDALRSAIPAMKVDCYQIGDFIGESGDAGLCLGGGDNSTFPGEGVIPVLPPTNAPLPVEPGSANAIAWGRYAFTTPSVALGDAKFGLDVRAMYESTTVSAAAAVYTQGSNAVTQNLNGTIGLVSLKSLSVDSSEAMKEDPLFNIFKWALYDDKDIAQNSNQNFQYADDVIQEALTNGNDMRLAAEGTVIFNVWMLMVHRLYEAVSLCKEKKSPLDQIDSAVALWIGEGQAEAKFESGWMLYSVAQSAAEYYGFDEAEAPINTELMMLFNRAQTLGQKCTTGMSFNGGNAAIELRAHVLHIIRRLTVPLVTSLLFHMVANSKNMVELYAVSVVPQVYNCDGDAAVNLEKVLYQGYTYSDINEDVLGNLATFLRCKRITCADIRVVDTESQKLKDLVGKLCEKLDYWDQVGMQLPMSGYIPSKDVSEISRLDLDILEIEILSELGAFDAAQDIYELGHHSFAKPDGSLRDLQSIARMSSLDEMSKFHLYSEYYGRLDFADKFILSALKRTGDFVGASWQERSELVSRALQTMVTYMAVQARLQEAVDDCKDGKAGLAELKWNEAAALWIGSAEGLVAASKFDVGRFMYALTNDVCDDFQVCAKNSEALVNQNMLASFASGRDSLTGSGSECAHIERTMKDEILPRMAIPLIQALIVNAKEYENPVALSKYSHATVHVLAKALIPLVKEVSDISALTLANAYGSFRQTTPGKASGVIDALAAVIRPLGLDCTEVGILKNNTNWAKCGTNGGVDGDGDGDTGGDGERDNDTIPVSETPTNLGNDLYVTSTYVKDKARIGFDVRDMERQLIAGNTITARNIYENGENSQISDSDGKFVALRSLRSFSLESSKDMVDEPLFNMFLYTLQDDNANFMQITAREYANSYVESALQNIDDADKTLPAEATVALNIWMEIVHQLYRTLSLCEQKELRDEEGIQSIDIAAAYWIGEGLGSDDGTKGHLLYALAEDMGSRFNIIEGGQSRTNRNVLRLFNKAKTTLSLPNACSENPITYVNLRQTVNKIIAVISIPLVQSLVHYLRSNDKERVKLYAHAVVPLVAGCNQATFEYLRAHLLTGKYNAVEIEDVVAKIQSLYPCLGLKCDDIGAHSSEVTEEVPSCIDEAIRSNLAGYTPANDVSDFARIDLDIREIDILMQMNAYKAAEETYMFGKNVENSNGRTMSLSEIATTSGRSIVPQYDAFSRFYDDKSFVDKIIQAALQGDGIWGGEQRRILVLKATQTIVMYFGALQAAYEAVSDCSAPVQSRSSVTKSDAWDRAAAFLIGSMEGADSYGTPEGYLFYSLAQEHCESFGTCVSSSGPVDVNNQLIDLLYAGRGAVLSDSCSGLQKIAGELSSLLLIPPIQGALLTSIQLNENVAETAPWRRAEGYVYSRALLPLVDDVNRDAAGIIEKNLGDRTPAKGTQISSEVFSSFASVYSSLGVDCELIGHIDGFDPCSGVTKSAEPPSIGSILIWATVGTSAAILLIGLLCFFRKRQENDTLPENNPKFIVSHGEFNNHSMNLLEKAFSKNTRTAPNTPEEKDRLTGSNDPSIAISDEYDDDDFDEAQALNSRIDLTPDII